MKKSLCLYFQIHLPFQFRRYRFFDIGNTNQYYDEFSIRNTLQRTAEQSYLPMNKVLLDIIREYGKDFKVAFSITGNTIEQMEMYAPEVLDSFKQLAKTGSVEFLCETYSHSLAFLKDESELDRQLVKQAQTIQKHFGQSPKVVRLTGLIYSDQIGLRVAKQGFEGLITEGAKHTLGWKSPNYIYQNPYNSNLKLLLRNYHLSDDIAYNFSNTQWDQWPITADKFSSWISKDGSKDEVINLFMDYITFGERHTRESGIFEFMRHLPKVIFESTNFEFSTPSEVINKYKKEENTPLHVPYPISWSEEERDLSIWLGNDLQNDAFNSLCELSAKISFLNNTDLQKDWERLQDSNNFYYMSTKWISDESKRRFINVYPNPYDAYINYMNILSDFTLRVDKQIDLKIKRLFKNKEYSTKIASIVSPDQIKYTSIQIKKLLELFDINSLDRSKPIHTKQKK